MNRGLRIAIIVVLTLVAVSILNAGRDWELGNSTSSSSGGIGYECAALIMLVITARALVRLLRRG